MLIVMAVALVLGGLLAVAVSRAVKARGLPKHTGWEELIGAIGEVRQPLDPVGQIFVQGALWRARLADPPAEATPPLERGSRVRVESVEGLTLDVSPIDGSDGAPGSVEADRPQEGASWGSS